MTTRPQKIPLGELRASGVRGRLICCPDYQCSHWAAISGDRWPDDLRLSDTPAKPAARGVLMSAQIFHWEQETRRAAVPVSA